MSAPAAPDAFAAVLGPGRGHASLVPGSTVRRAVASDLLSEFIDCCSTVVETVLGRDDAPVPLVDGIEFPAAMFKAYLLFQACEAPGVADWDERVALFCQHTRTEVWALLGFACPPSHLEVGLAFAAFRDSRHGESELRAFATGVELFAVSGLFRELYR